MGQGSSGTTVPAPPHHSCHHRAPAFRPVASLSLWGAGDSAMASMWQEVGTVTHGWLCPLPPGGWDSS